MSDACLFAACFFFCHCIQQLAKVSKVENPAGFVYHIYFDTQEDMRSKVFDFAHDNGLKILQLHQKNTTLEKLFVELTSG